MTYGDQTKLVNKKITVTTEQVGVESTNVTKLVNKVKDWFSLSKLTDTLEKGLGLYKDGQNTQGWNPSYAREMLTELGITDSTLQNQYFGKYLNFGIDAFFTPTVNAETLSASEESPKLTLELSFALADGYTWNDKSQQALLSNSNYKLSDDQKTLYVYVDADLTPSLTVTPTRAEITVNKDIAKMFSASVQVNKSNVTVTWYAKLNNRTIFEIKSGSQQIKTQFGANAGVEISNSDGIYSLDVTNIDNLDNINNMKIFAVVVEANNGSYYQQSYNVTPITINITSDSMRPTL